MLITDFFDKLKSATKGYASMEYNIIDYRASDLCRLDVKINYELAPALACVVHQDNAQSIGRRLVKSLKNLIPRQMFKVPIQVRFENYYITFQPGASVDVFHPSIFL